jgi:Outer membrane protein and related peptidoglycan-associated (lipo)proteins
MKLTQLSRVLVLGLVLGVAAVGCKTKKQGTTPLQGGSGAGLSGAPIGSGSPFGVDGQGPFGGMDVPPGGGDLPSFDPDQMHQDRGALAPYTVYFGYDSAAISGGERSKLEAVAAALRSDMSARLLIEGHCDERGTEEYNRSLGERRALSAREALAGMGVDPARVATRTYGEDRPAEFGHDEAAWSRNRRGEFVLLHPR